MKSGCMMKPTTKEHPMRYNLSILLTLITAILLTGCGGGSGGGSSTATTPPVPPVEPPVVPSQPKATSQQLNSNSIYVSFTGSQHDNFRTAYLGSYTDNTVGFSQQVLFSTSGVTGSSVDLSEDYVGFARVQMIVVVDGTRSQFVESSSNFTKTTTFGSTTLDGQSLVSVTTAWTISSLSALYAQYPTATSFEFELKLDMPNSDNTPDTLYDWVNGTDTASQTLADRTHVIILSRSSNSG